MRRLLVIQNDALSGPGVIEQALRDAGAEIDLWLAFRHADRCIDLTEHDGILAFGGRASPTSRRPWLDHERDVIAVALERRIPYLGVCLGGELLAQVAGGSAPETPPRRVGWTRLQPTGDAPDPLLGDLARTVFEWHYNGIQAPPEAMVLARAHADQAFRVGECAWGVQFHLEVDLDIVARFTVDVPDELHDSSLAAEDLRRETARHAPDNVAWAHSIARRFVELADVRATTGRDGR